MIQSGIERLLLRLPTRTPTDADRAAFNADAAQEAERIRDFIILHYATNAREEPFWADRRAMPLPDSLAARIDLFRSSGRIDRGERDLFTELAWQQVLIGQAILPENYHPLASQLNDSDLSAFLETVRRSVAGSVANMPTHRDFIAAQAAAGNERRMA